MNDPESRPDPDALVRRAYEEEGREKRARLRIFFGFAPGVGKTYRMLQVARERAIEQKLDVVAGIVETHGRAETEALLEGLDVLSRRKVEYRGRALDELDLDAALARRPKILLLDELAHTNAPGSRHAKRWQDAIELLDAGIDVYTTVNVQHVESLNDVVAQITGIQVRETIPDSILERADEIELVDIAPEELLARLREGKVYLPEQAKRATAHFFKRGNLLALRELALRRTAERVDVDMREYREQHGVVTPWPAGERILVCISPAPSSGRLMRAASRMAAGLRAPWVAAYVESPAVKAPSEADRARLESHLRLAEMLGGTVTRLSGTSISEALLRYARKHNVTRIIIGKPTHSRLRDRLRGSLLDEVVRGSGDVDVHVISGSESAETAPVPAEAPKEPTRAVMYGWAVLLVVATTVLAAAVHAVYPVPDLEVLYVLAVMLAAVRFGRGPSILAAALGVAGYDFFFVPPFHTLNVADARYFLTFAMMFGVGLLLSELTARIQRQEQDARHREAWTAALYELSRDLAAADDTEAVAAAVARHAEQVFEATAHVLQSVDDGAMRAVAVAPAATSLDSADLAVARWAFEHARPSGLGTDTLPGSKIVCAPLTVRGAPLGVLVLAPKGTTPLGAEQRAFLDAFCRQAAFAFDRVRLTSEANTAALRAKTEEMRSSLLSAVSHDLRTPLSAITGAATALRDDGGLGANTRAELLDSICEEAERLERLVANLLDMTRLEAGPVALKREWVPLEELVGSALTRLERKLGERPVNVAIAEALPLLSVDPVLFEQVFINLFENAARYTSPGSPIEVLARSEPGVVLIEVADAGPGLPAGSESRIFEKFYRGGHTGSAGAGLGLAICKAIVEAHGGTITAENRRPSGANFRIRVPIPGVAPSISSHVEEARP
ncbi:sensor histidine kinase KdpD [Polyangium sp. 6x1]|uniref:sensor histidine kinase KdpD n=1 Tax=Polyangium sp. 6x1 TaxID=3042689 RepID=UPI002482B3B4|nr:sensor histidine kinase KdpD [Polyangium sp. 6x1]MDI1445907.1 sensor histidine kinase KdpD [Polyangium sp. 6x1]